MRAANINSWELSTLTGTQISTYGNLGADLYCPINVAWKLPRFKRTGDNTSTAHRYGNFSGAGVFYGAGGRRSPPSATVDFRLWPESLPDIAPVQSRHATEVWQPGLL